MTFKQWAAQRLPMALPFALAPALVWIFAGESWGLLTTLFCGGPLIMLLHPTGIMGKYYHEEK